MKRCFDIALSTLGLAVSAPLLAPLALAVKLTSPGPAFFIQTRVGRSRRPIRVIKLRTMVADAESRGAAVTAARDPRVTPLGRILRAAKLDELPQLWNVLRGDMSFVGPRPESPRYVARYRPEWEPLFSVRPGITDVASLVFRDEEALLAAARDRELAYFDAIVPVKLRLALEGVERSTREGLRYDVTIILRTLLAVLRGPSAEPALGEARAAIDALNRASDAQTPGSPR